MRCVKLSAAVALAGVALVGCAANPIVARDPVPPPTGHEVVSCDTIDILDPDTWERGHPVRRRASPDDWDTRELDRRGFDFRAIATDCEAAHRYRHRNHVTTKG